MFIGVLLGRGQLHFVSAVAEIVPGRLSLGHHCGQFRHYQGMILILLKHNSHRSHFYYHLTTDEDENDIVVVFEQYSGEWYENRKYFAIFELGQHCIRATYTIDPTNSGIVKVVNSGLSYM